jgi:Tfp pilus assembly protein PilN
VERSLGDDVALLSLQPEPARQQLHLDAEAKDAHAMLDYVAQLGATAGFRNVALKHHEINDQNPYQPYRFQVDMEWQDTAP